MKTSSGAQPLVPPAIADALHAELNAAADEIFDTVPRELPVFAEVFTAELGDFVKAAIKKMLAGFLVAACGSRSTRAGVDPATVEETAFRLGQYEAQVGRPIDALNASFRLGARIAWRHWSATAQAHGMETGDIARFAELNFYYIDTLADAAVSGHAGELASAGQRRQRAREYLAEKLLAGADPDEVLAATRLAEWRAPESMIAVTLPRAETRNAIPLLDPHTLMTNGDLVPGQARSDLAVLLVPVTVTASRAALIGRLAGIRAVVGPEQPWLEVHYSAILATRAWGYRTHETWPVDTESALAALVVDADPRTRERQRAVALASFDHLRPDTRARYEETLRAWLLHQGRREDVARHLVLHPQTVRYRMDRIREILGDTLSDPERVLDLVIALA
ncbi:PucR family transcriptional regulator [Nocardia rhizosphaerihabitans]|uniref:PucR family transcriptional regulator n=1 Tax=Nocardia rhizosphaerihabitans TaxID=1691570 RepID=UPI00366B8F19